jgi:choline kinase
MKQQVTVLAAGMGTRLGSPFPKPLTPLSDGRTILQQQIDNIQAVYGPDVLIQIVVGFKLDLILEAAPNCSFVYNEHYDQTNTSKSLLKALRASPDGPLVWMNGDIVFDAEVLRRLQPFIDSDQTAIAVNSAKVSEEEVKYTVDSKGMVAQLGKNVVDGLGESIGINVVAAKDKQLLIKQLEACDDNDYFERGIELGIEKDGLEVFPVDISDLFAIEIDFREDLDRANQYTANNTASN